MRTTLRITVVLYLSLCLGRAYAVPSFARQTGLTCNVCHRNPPELTAFGRNFKLRGFVLSAIAENDKVGNSKDLTLTKYMPISAMVLISNTVFQTKQPASQNNAANFPQQLSIFLAGGYASHFGGLAQFTYTHADDHFGMDNTDFRYANKGTLGGKDWEYGITLNNNPSVEDLWNSTPAWGFPWISTASGVGPIASPVIYGSLAQDVAGAGWFSHVDTHLVQPVEQPSLHRCFRLPLGACRSSDSGDRNRPSIQHQRRSALLARGVATELGRELSDAWHLWHLYELIPRRSFRSA